MWKEVIELHYPDNPDAGLLLAFEDGYTTWELESYVDMHSKDWEFFKNEVVKGLVEEAKAGDTITKVIGIDTIDRMMQKAEDYILRKMSKKLGKNLTSLQDITQTSQTDNGYIMLKQEVWKQLDILKNAGYGFFWLGWTKEKETTTLDGLKFNSIELALSKTGRDIFESQAHLIVCLFNEVKVLDKEGNEIDRNATAKSGKELASNFHSTETVMYFRPSSYINIAGGRFTNLPEKVSYSAENFLNVFEDAVKAQLKKTDANIQQLSLSQQQESNLKSKEYAKEQVKIIEQESVSADDIIKQIDTKLTQFDNQSKAVIGQQFKALFNGNANYRKITDIEQLKQALELVNNI